MHVLKYSKKFLDLVKAIALAQHPLASLKNSTAKSFCFVIIFHIN